LSVIPTLLPISWGGGPRSGGGGDAALSRRPAPPSVSSPYGADPPPHETGRKTRINPATPPPSVPTRFAPTAPPEQDPPSASAIPSATTARTPPALRPSAPPPATSLPTVGPGESCRRRKRLRHRPRRLPRINRAARQTIRQHPLPPAAQQGRQHHHQIPRRQPLHPLHQPRHPGCAQSRLDLGQGSQRQTQPPLRPRQHRRRLAPHAIGHCLSSPCRG